VSTRSARPIPDTLAAVDLGSNSFHMVVARYSHGQLLIIDRLREMVRLGAGVKADGRLDPAVSNRALACLERFGQRLRHMKPDSVRVVGTNALRRSKRAGAFLERARAALGHPIEIISGREEARLIYSGVAHTMPTEPGRRLVCDIGGGSTEVIIGESLNPLELESLQIGCVRTSEEFFAEGRVSDKRMQRARLAARQAIDPYQAAFRRRGWDQAVGSSGTVRAIGDAVRELDPAATQIDLAGLEALVTAISTLQHIRDLPLASVTDDRKLSFAGGVAILIEVFEQLGIEQMRVADGAMREGLLYDLIGRYTDEDARERTVRSMQARYHVDISQADRVEKLAISLFESAQEAWDVDAPEAELMLRWAARLHEVGLDVAHSGYHRHGAYLLEHADMAGFPREEQMLLSQLVGAHRRKPDLARLDELVAPWDDYAAYLIVVLRLAVLLHRSRSAQTQPAVRLVAKGRSLELSFPTGWLDAHPLTVADLSQEIEHLKTVDFRLRVYSQRDR
jgi:exopolyphosphatase/guanosine-5'-triphosphate,3'-diphosphate pyrophosphatase